MTRLRSSKQYRERSHRHRPQPHASSHRPRPQASSHRSRLRPASPILFYHRDKPYYEFTNFSPHAVRYEGHVYPTAEHLFQASKFISSHPHLAERIRRLPSSRAALEEATRLRRLQRSDWFEVNMAVMSQVLEAKFNQHPHLRQMLLDTGDRVLIEDSPVDSFWGIGADGKGRNELGKALMALRADLRRDHSA